MAMPVYTRLSKYRETHIKEKSNNGACPHLTACLQRANFMCFLQSVLAQGEELPFDKDPKEL